MTHPRPGQHQSLLHHDVATRFWRKVDRRNPDDCWPWTGTMNNRFGRFYPSRSRSSRVSFPAHVVAYTLSIGPVPDGVRVKQTCGNSLCCNPAHLCASNDTATLFWLQVDRRGADECWLWRGYVDPAGQPSYFILGSHHTPHRYAYSLTIGTLQPGERVIRTCATSLCCNPAHMKRVGCQDKVLSDAARDLAESCYRLAWHKALQVAVETGYHPDDLLSEAMHILICLARWFDPRKGRPFAPVAGKFLTIRLRQYTRRARREVSFTDCFGEDWRGAAEAIDGQRERRNE